MVKQRKSLGGRKAGSLKDRILDRIIGAHRDNWSSFVKSRSRIYSLVLSKWREMLSRVMVRTVIRGIKKRFSLFGGVSRHDYFQNIKAIEKRPWNLHIEITNVCNSDCIFCASKYQKRPKGVIPDNIFRKALKDYCDIGGGDLLLRTIVGEPFIDKEFIRKIQIARSMDSIQNISTSSNGSLLHTVDMLELLKSGISEIKISLAPLDKELYENIYRNGQYETVKRNVYNLLYANDKLNYPVKINLAFRTPLTMKKTLSLQDYKPLKDFKHDVNFNIDYDSWLGHIRQEDLVLGMYLRPSVAKRNEPCHVIYEGPIIHLDGSVGMCGHANFDAKSEMIVGNIQSNSLIDIWRSQNANEIRQNCFAGHHPKICDNCNAYYDLHIYKTKLGNVRRHYIESVYKELACAQVTN